MTQTTKHIRLFDGAMGTMLEKKNDHQKVLYEDWNLQYPALIQNVHRQYIASGVDFITANTFGANRIKLKSSRYSLNEILDAAINNAHIAAQNTAVKVMLDIGPTGLLMQPMGPLSVEAAYENIKEVVNYTKDRVDGYILETFSDLLEIKAAILAVKENCDLPVFATMTIDESGSTLTGASPEIIALTLTSLQVDALGINCSTGPNKMVDFVRKMRRFTHLPILIQPNKGLPQLKNSEVSYSFSDADFAYWMERIVDAGADIIGGCCGTTPQSIQAISYLKQRRVHAHPTLHETYICSGTCLLKLNKGILCGERLNPTGKKALQKALLEHDFNFLQQEALRQEAAGADFLDLNVGIPHSDEKQLIVEAVKRIQEVCKLPLQLDSANPDAIEAALRVYNGVPIINSVNGNPESMNKLLPIVAKYGAVCVALPLNKNGIPETAKGRLEIAHEIITEAQRYGIDHRHLVFDALVMTISSNQQHGRITLETIGLLKKLKVLTIVGLSNVSFGLPQRAYLNRTFLIMALQAGLDIAIMNPNDRDSVHQLKAFNALAGYDENCAAYIAEAEVIESETALTTVSSGTSASKIVSTAPRISAAVSRANSGSCTGSCTCSSTTELSNSFTSTADKLYQAIVHGLKDSVKDLTEQTLEHQTPESIINDILIPALTEVGNRFETKKLFLPQLILSAETAKVVFAGLASHFSQTASSKGTIVLATVQGDIHDIGKNIVKIVLESHGFKVIDLGKDVAIERVTEAFLQYHPDAIGLSALMTTTVESMAQTIVALHQIPDICPIIVGGAVLTEEIAHEIGADIYGADALSTVRKLEEFINHSS